MFDFFKKPKGESTLFYQTDVHSHVCPGIDDGAKSSRQALELVSEMHKLGIRRMITTPHVTDETFPNNPDTINIAFEKLKKAVETVGLDMKLDHSAEYRIDELLYKYLDTGQVEPLPNNYILVENSWIQEPYSLDSFLFKLQADYGLKPILAHPERYRYYQGDHRRLKQIHEKGILFQVNLLSLAGHYDKTCKQTAEWLLENDYVDFVGSDLHRSAHIESYQRYIKSKDYRKLLAKSDRILNDTTFE